MTQRIPIAGPWITDKEIAYVADAARNAWQENATSFHQRFERAFADYHGVRHAVALPSCTSAIHLALAALGIGPGDEVIVPDITWIASAAPIHYLGATIVFADIDPDNWCLCPKALKSCITPRTKAVIPVDLYGNLPAMEEIGAIAEQHGLAVIEDAAEAIGSRHGERVAGTWGEIGVFSFHGSKTMTAGEGGMLITNRDDLRDRVLVLADHGRKPGDRSFRIEEVGYKYKLSSMQAAMGLAQLERLNELVDRKRQIFEWYRADLGDIKLQLNSEPAGTRNSYWMTTAVIDSSLGLTKDVLRERLGSAGIDTRPFFHPLSSLNPFRDSEPARRAQERNRVAYDISPRGINLPSALTLTREQVQFVSSQLKEILAQASPRPVPIGVTGDHESTRDTPSAELQRGTFYPHDHGRATMPDLR